MVPFKRDLTNNQHTFQHIDCKSQALNYVLIYNRIA